MPLALGRAFRPDGDDRCYLTLLHPPGGVVGGDELDVRVVVEAEAKCVMTTTAATKIYRSESATSTLRTTIDAHENASVEWIPQETIVFDGARARSLVHVTLRAGAEWLGWEIVRLGRTARGESFRSGVWRSQIVVERDGLPLWIDRQRIEGGSRHLTSRHGLGGAVVIAQFASIGECVDATTIEALRELAASIGSGATGVSRLEHGFICRYRGTSTADAAAWFHAVRARLQTGSSGSASSVERFWNLDPVREKESPCIN
jgi:urease accessory protein